MQWSRVKSRFFELLLPSAVKRLNVFITSYSERDPQIGRGWVTIDGVEVFSTESKQLVYDAIASYPSLKLPTLLNSENGVQRCLALIDRRLGSRAESALESPAGFDALFRACRELRRECVSREDGPREVLSAIVKD